MTMPRNKDTHVKKALKKIGRSDPERLKKPIFFILIAFLALSVLVVSLVNQEIAKLDQLAGDLPEADTRLQEKIDAMTEGYPIQKMSGYISRKDEKIAAYLIAIAKKESNWGKRVPILNGKDCYNYWGYRGIRERMGSGGHTCFDSPKDAVDTVSRRLAYFILKKQLESPSDMVVWKCGSNCDSHSSESVRKWISDVSFYYDQLMGEPVSRGY